MGDDKQRDAAKVRKFFNELDNCVNEVFRTNAGKELVLKLLNFSGFMGEPSPRNNEDLNRLEGKRSVGQLLFNSLCRNGLEMRLPERKTPKEGGKL